MRVLRYEWLFDIHPERTLIVAFHWCGWGSIQLGFHVDLKAVNAQLFIPFMFFHVGLESVIMHKGYCKEVLK